MSGGPVAVLEWFVGYPQSGKVQARVVQQGRQSDIALIDYRADRRMKVQSLSHR